MSKSTSKNKSANRSLQEVVLVGLNSRSEPGVDMHVKVGMTATKPLKELEKEWGIVTEQVIVLLDQTDKVQSEKGFELDEVTFELAINAKGQIGFVVGGELGGQASISLKFTRKK